jgi:DNA-binding transcriptional MocR family regulator
MSRGRGADKRGHRRAIAILRRHRADIHAVSVSPDGADIEQMEAILRKVRPKLFYCVPDFQNPVGIVYPMENRAAVAGLAQRHGFLVIQDSPYRALRYPDTPSPPDSVLRR